MAGGYAEVGFTPFKGMMSELPEPRARTPSPVRKTAEAGPKNTQFAREFEVDVSHVDVVYAEDEEVFRETAIRQLEKAGFARQHIYESENGLGALENLAKLQDEGNISQPLVVLLDIRMPGMDGKECALQIQEMVKNRLLRRQPFVVCISSIHRQIQVEEGGGNFQIVLPKPISAEMVEKTLEFIRKWWTMGVSRTMPAWKVFSPATIDVIVADEEPVCQMASGTAFQHAGILPTAVTEVDSEEDLVQRLRDDDGTSERPLILLLGTAAWATPLKEVAEQRRTLGRREPFIVCTSVDSDRIGSSAAVTNFHAFLPRTFSQDDVKWCLELCRLWWLSKGDGSAPVNPEDEDEEEPEPLEALSECSEDDEDDA